MIASRPEPGRRAADPALEEGSFRARFDESLRKKIADDGNKTEPEPQEVEEAAAPTAEPASDASAADTAEPSDSSDGAAPEAPGSEGSETPQEDAVPTGEAAGAADQAVSSRPFTIHALNSLLLKADVATRIRSEIGPARREAAAPATSETNRRTDRGGAGEATPPSSGLSAERGPVATRAGGEFDAEPTRGPGADAGPVVPREAPATVTPDRPVEAESETASLPAVVPARQVVLPGPGETPTNVVRSGKPAGDTPAEAAPAPRVGAVAGAGGQPSGQGGLRFSLGTRQGPGAAAGPDQQALTAQVTRGLLAAVNQRNGAVTIRLTPESLGQLRIRVNVRENVVTAEFKVSSKEAQRAIDGSLESLRGTLAEKGLRVQELRVEVADPVPSGAPSERHGATGHPLHGSADRSQGGLDPDQPSNEGFGRGSQDPGGAPFADDDHEVLIPVAAPISARPFASLSAAGIDTLA